ncbi:MAG: formate dehydrogenase subunit gamma [Rhodospirillales bacterium]|nr:formate dehydrogenase subunit gamma [Rhodospirillales bacterium]
MVVFGAAAGLTGSVLLDATPAAAQTGGSVPGNFSGNLSDAELWRAVRKGVRGNSDMQDPMAATLVQSEGDNWRAFKNGLLSQFGGWLLVAVLIGLALFRMVRGQVKIDSGPSGQTVERFNALERATHWLTASSFVVLGLSGLNVLYGKYVLSPIIGKAAFASLTYYGKIAHNYIGFAFMVGIVLMFVMWVRHNLLDATDLKWIAHGGGLLTKGDHPPAKRFNFGQKCIFWIVVLGGLTLSVSGLALLFPYEITPWGGTFAALNIFGFGLPTNLTALQETQISVLWHSVTALGMIAVIIAHIYIGTPLGMEGALDAVTSGQVDTHWIKEHHSLFAEEMGITGTNKGGGEHPAE